MSDVYSLHQGHGPLLISMPHSGTQLPDDIRARLTDNALRLQDTDWHIPQLYDFVDRNEVSVLQANMSRYVVDLNRAPDNQPLYPGQYGTGLCPTQSFRGEALYKAESDQPSDAEIAQRVADFWQPYHQSLASELQRIKAIHGYALLYDAHSIASQVPSLFEGELPALNLGTAKGSSCAAGMTEALGDCLKRSPYSCAVNGRFVGGYITRQYGKPDEHIHAVQMEIAQIHYMDEEDFQWQSSRGEKLQQTLQTLLATFIDQGKKHYG